MRTRTTDRTAAVFLVAKTLGIPQTLRGVAAAAGLNIDTVSDLLACQKRPRPATLQKLATALRTDLAGIRLILGPDPEDPRVAARRQRFLALGECAGLTSIEAISSSSKIPAKRLQTYVAGLKPSAPALNRLARTFGVYPVAVHVALRGDE